MEQRTFWLTFVSSALGGTIFALATIPPASAVANLTGWVQMISGLRLPVAAQGIVTAIAILAAILGLITSFISYASIRGGVLGDEFDKRIADAFKHAGRR